MSGPDPGLAAKVAYLAGVLGDADVVATAAASDDARVRGAAASAELRATVTGLTRADTPLAALATATLDRLG